MYNRLFFCFIYQLTMHVRCRYWVLRSVFTSVEDTKSMAHDRVIGVEEGWVSSSVLNNFKRRQFKAREHGIIGIGGHQVQITGWT